MEKYYFVSATILKGSRYAVVKNIFMCKTPAVMHTILSYYEKEYNVEVENIYFRIILETSKEDFTLRASLAVFTEEDPATKAMKEAIDEQQEKLNELQKLLNSPIETVGFRVRTINALRAADIRIVADLVSTTRARLMRYRNFGRKSMEDIDYFVERHGLCFSMNPGDYGFKRRPIDDLNNKEHGFKYLPRN